MNGRLSQKILLDIMEIISLCLQHLIHFLIII